MSVAVRTLFAVSLAVVITACGSSGVRRGLEGHELDRFAAVAPPATAQLPAPPTSHRVERTFLLALFNDAQGVWRSEFRSAHVSYKAARVVVFSSATSSPCGEAKEGSGPFYCPADATVYLDTTFFMRLDDGDTVDAAAQAYIVGHEMAHHVQRLVGIAERTDAAKEADPSAKNKLATQTELQADCLAGVWARSAFPRSALTTANLLKGMVAADKIGDDYDARLHGQYDVDSEEWTHGSSAQRQLWLRTGFQKGRPTACNTFAYG
jgi:hypothetical protein